MMVTAINRTSDLLLLGDKYLFPNEGRRVPVHVYLEARDRLGAGLFSPDAPDPDALDEYDEEDDAPDEFSLAVLDGDPDAADLESLSRAELAETARTLGIVPGRKTKSELLAAIRECD